MSCVVTMIGITKLQIPPAKSHKATLKYFDPNTFKEDVCHIPFQICNIFNYVSDQYWATNWLFTEVLNEHAPLKERTIKEDQVPYMHFNLRKEMYKRNMLKTKHLNDRGNQIKRIQYTKQQNKVTAMRKKCNKGLF